MSVSVLPNGRAQFIDLNGFPLIGGLVFHFVQDSDTPKDTWQDPNQDALNSNPIVLDERGQASIWGTGMYRQRVLDSLGNEIWDVPTSAMCECATDGGGSVGNYYEVAAFFVGSPAADQDILIYNFSQSVTFPDNFAGATPRVGINPGSTTIYVISRVAADGTIDTIGSMTISDAGVVTFATTETPEFEAGGALIVTAPADSDGVADISFTLIGNPVA